jgi:putative pyruvate formate lyase activating enzyme
MIDMDISLLQSCVLCPHRCGVDRLAGELGVCGAGVQPVVARAALHHWEEPPISGSRGSGTVFFSHCTLGCAYCQNADISHGHAGRELGIERLAAIFCELEAQGAHNINLVTPTHYVPQILAALDEARAAGLGLPIVYNTSGYENAETIALLRGYVDIFLTDYRYVSPALAARYSNAPRYPQAAQRALAAMFDLVGEYALDKDSMLVSGIIVRFLLLPGQVGEAQAAVSTVFSAYGNRVCYSLMNQYTPMPGVGERFPELARPVSEEEYDELIDFALDLGVTNSFMQEGGTAQESYIPPFDLTGVDRSGCERDTG